MIILISARCNTCSFFFTMTTTHFPVTYNCAHMRRYKRFLSITRKHLAARKEPTGQRSEFDPLRNPTAVSASPCRQHAQARYHNSATISPLDPSPISTLDFTSLSVGRNNSYLLCLDCLLHHYIGCAHS